MPHPIDLCTDHSGDQGRRLVVDLDVPPGPVAAGLVDGSEGDGFASQKLCSTLMAHRHQSRRGAQASGSSAAATDLQCVAPGHDGCERLLVASAAGRFVERDAAVRVDTPPVTGESDEAGGPGR
jgi:hypothetical protein